MGFISGNKLILNEIRKVIQPFHPLRRVVSVRDLVNVSKVVKVKVSFLMRKICDVHITSDIRGIEAFFEIIEE